jgi:hypothetical protein
MAVSAKKFCKGTFTSNAAAIENSEAIMANGSTFYAVLDRINKQTGDSGICGKGEHCHPAPKDRFNCKLKNENYISYNFEKLWFPLTSGLTDFSGHSPALT